MTGREAIAAISEAHADLGKAFDEAGKDVHLMVPPCSYQWTSTALLLIVACHLATLAACDEPADVLAAAFELRRRLWTQEGCAELVHMMTVCAANIRVRAARREVADGPQAAGAK